MSVPGTGVPARQGDDVLWLVPAHAGDDVLWLDMPRPAPAAARAYRVSWDATSIFGNICWLLPRHLNLADEVSNVFFLGAEL